MIRVLSTLAVLTVSCFAAADTIYVPAGGDIQKAINMVSDGDVIQLEAGLYEPYATIDTIGRAVTIRGVVDKNGDPESVIDGQGKMRVLQCISGETSETRFERLVISHGVTSAFGAGMFNDSSSPTLTNCTFTENSADYNGGGMGNYDNSSPTLTNCTFTENLASGGGGMFNVNSSPTLTNCAFMGNIDRSDFAAPSQGGGGMNNYDNSSPALTNCTFEDNSADKGGGGMYNYYNSSPTLIDCTFTNNTAADYGGGGMYNDFSSPILTNCTFLGNSTDSAYGGGMSNSSSSSPTLTDCTLINNTAALGGGLYSNSNSLPILAGSLLCGNSPNQIYGPWHDDGDNTVATECDSCPDSDGDGVCDEDDQCPGEPDVDSDGDGIPDCLECPGDITANGIVDAADLGILLAVWGTDGKTTPDADVNNDGIVNGGDLGLLLFYWGQCP